MTGPWWFEELKMIRAGQVPVVPYEENSPVRSQSFLEMMSILPMMFIMFFFMLMMGLMRDIAREPGKAQELIVKGVETGKQVVGGISGAIKGGS
jgi:hypothetical protein